MGWMLHSLPSQKLPTLTNGRVSPRKQILSSGRVREGARKSTKPLLHLRPLRLFQGWRLASGRSSASIDKHSKSQVSLPHAAQYSSPRPQTLASPSPQLLHSNPSPPPGSYSGPSHALLSAVSSFALLRATLSRVLCSEMLTTEYLLRDTRAFQAGAGRTQISELAPGGTAGRGQRPGRGGARTGAERLHGPAPPS